MVFRYENLNHYRGWTTSNLEYQLVVNAFVYIDDDGEPMVGTVTCSSNHAEVDAEKRALNDLQKDGYVNYLRALTPLKRVFNRLVSLLQAICVGGRIRTRQDAS
jgi:hypothetical protein